MKLRIKAVKIVIKTSQKSFGAKFEFDTEGLNVIRADNSMGKSTIYNSMIYALGLETIIGNTTDIPLTYIVANHVEEGGKKLPILESYVLLEITNEKKKVKTIKRNIVTDNDPKLVEIYDGPCVTNPEFKPTVIEKFYVRSSGSAQNEKGFHKWLSNYLGWELPSVPKFNGAESLLYLECIFPLFIVEQKRGWVQLQATVPQYGIKDVKQKALEFVMKLDSEKNNSTKRDLNAQLNYVIDSWHKANVNINRSLKSINGQSDGIPEEPVLDLKKDLKPVFKVSSEGKWISIDDKIEKLFLRLKEIDDQISIKGKSINGVDTSKTLKVLEDELFQREAQERSLTAKLSDENSEIELLDRRIAGLNDDIRQMSDAFKIAQMSTASRAIEELRNCPLCDVHLDGTTMSQDVKRHVMSVEDNLSFLKEELKAVEFLKESCEQNKDILEKSRQSLADEVSALREKIRAQKKALVADDRLPSTAILQERVTLEFDIKRHVDVYNTCKIELDPLFDLSKKFGVVKGELAKIPKGLSETDEEKILQLASTLKSYLTDFEFKSFEVNELSISEYTLHPVVEDFDWYFQASGSDNIRAIWAYTLALLSLSKSFPINHPGFLMYDEPGQHSARHESLKAFLAKASTLGVDGGQIIITTSEKISNLNNYLAGTGAKTYFFEDKDRLIKELND